MAGLPWKQWGVHKRERAQQRIDADDVAVAIEDRHADDDDACGFESCGDRCSMCVPDWRAREAALRALARSQPAFTLADRLLAQVGLILRPA